MEENSKAKILPKELAKTIKKFYNWSGLFAFFYWSKGFSVDFAGAISF